MLISCSKRELEIIHTQARTLRSTVSGYVLNIVMRAVAVDERLFAQLGSVVPSTWPLRRPGAKAVVHIRCSPQDAKRIKDAATRRRMTSSGFMVMALESSWRARQLAAKAIGSG